MPVDFGLVGAPSAARIVVAMSGGVDSSVAAALASQTGAEVIGVTLQLYDHGEAVKRTGSCCAGQDIYDAKMVADRLGIAHYVLDYESRFRTGVIDRFADEYAMGRTPVPCSLCNQGVKFTDLIAFARELGADCLATGHYVRRVVNGDRVELHKGADPSRDQSYFLYGTTAEQLDFLRFPVGDLPRWFASVHPRFVTPANSIAFLGVIAAVLALIGTYIWLAVISTLARLIVYSVTIAARPMAPGQAKPPVWFYVMGAAGIALCIWGAAQATAEAWRTLVALALAGALLYAIARRATGSASSTATVSAIQPPPSSREPS